MEVFNTLLFLFIFFIIVYKLFVFLFNFLKNLFTRINYYIDEKTNIKEISNDKPVNSNSNNTYKSSMPSWEYTTNNYGFTKEFHKPQRVHISDFDEAISQFRLRRSILTPCEQTFFTELNTAFSYKYNIYPQVHLGALFEPKSRIKNWGLLSRLNKRIDFVMFDKQTLFPVIAIELDDSSHEKESRRNRDRFVEDLFRSNNIPFVRYNHGSYSASEIRNILSKSGKI